MSESYGQVQAEVTIEHKGEQLGQEVEVLPETRKIKEPENDTLAKIIAIN